MEQIIREHTQKIVRSGVLGRARSYARLLEFLVESSARGRTPKELEIATEVFGKGPDFDPSQDSMVRVYAHNLRQKLDHYYATAGREEAQRIAIPKGEYRVVLIDAQETQEPAPGAAPAQAGNRMRLVLGGLALLLLGLLIGFSLRPAADSGATPHERVARSPIWAGLLDDNLPILVVVGDYYIFAELDGRGNVARLVREFSINSSRDLDDTYQSELRARYMDLDLTYLPRASAVALRDLLRVLYTRDKSVRLVSMSELNVAELRSNHIVYVGYVSGLDKLRDFVFASSGLSVGETYDELTNNQTGQLYASGAGFAADYRNYRDYGLYSTFPGPGGNRVVIVAGTRDAGLMHTAYVVTEPVQVRALERAMPHVAAVQPPAFEALYEVMGFDRASLDATLVHSAPLDYRAIWGGEPLRFRSSP